MKFMIIEVDFLDHWKTRMLVNELDGDELAPTYLIRLWAHCQTRKTDQYPNLKPNAIKAICRYSGDAQKLEEALVKCTFISRDDLSVTILGWAERNRKWLSSMENGKKGGRPKKTDENPTINPPEREEIRRDEIRLEEKRLKKPERTRETPNSGSVESGSFQEISDSVLRNTPKLLAWHFKAVANKLVGVPGMSEHGKRQVVAMAEHCLRIGKNPSAAFVDNVQKGRWNFITLVDEDAANERLRSHVGRGRSPPPRSSSGPQPIGSILQEVNP